MARTVRERTRTPRKDLSLEQLLRLKRAELPQDAFWEGFDQSLRQRMFKAAVQRQRSGIRGFLSALAHSRSTYAMPVLAALTIMAGLAMRDRAAPAAAPVTSLPGTVDMVVAVEAPVASPGTAERRSFVVDSLSVNLDSGSYRKVMDGDSLRLGSGSGTRYVADQLGNGRASSGILFSSASF